MFIQAIPPFKGKRTGATPPVANPTAPASATPALPAPSRSSSSNANGASAPTPLSPTSGANRLNVNASSFKPITKTGETFTVPAPIPDRRAKLQNALPPNNGPATNGNSQGAAPSSSSASPKPKTAESSPTPQGPPNPFFGVRLPKKGPPPHIKDEFNPFKYNKVVDASQVCELVVDWIGGRLSVVD